MKKKHLLILLSNFVGLNFLFAQTWTGTVSSNWSTAGNWSTNAVPISTGSVTIPGTAISNWPSLSQNTECGRLTLQSGSQMDLKGFDLTLNSQALNTTGAVFNNSVAGSHPTISILTGIASINGTTFNGDFSFFGTSPNQTFNEANSAPNTFNGDVTFTVGLREGLSISEGFASTYNGDVTVVRLDEDGATQQMFRAGGVVVQGNFSYTNPQGGILRLGTTAADTRIKGTINMEADAPAASGTSLAFYRVKNETTGGNINLDYSTTSGLQEDSLVVNSITLSGTGQLGLTDNYFKGNLSIIAATGPIYLNGNVFDGDFSLDNQTGSAYESYNTSEIFMGNATFKTSVSVGYSDTATFYKNLTINSDAGITLNNLKFAGSTNSVFTQLGTQVVTMKSIKMDKTLTGKLTLNSPVAVTSSVTFINGNIYTSASSALRFNNLINHTGASVASHVVGPVEKLGGLSASAPFTFPIGTDVTYNPVTKSNSATASDLFSAQYFQASPNSVGDTTQKASTLKRISNCEYWDVQRLNGTTNVTLTFTFGNPCSSGAGQMYINDPSKINIAHWTGSTWEDLGNGGSTGATSGTVTTGGPVTTFSPFTFGSTDVVLNPLPLQLISFNAVKQQQSVSITWTTENEKNFSHFEIERANSDDHFVSIGSIKSGNEAQQQYAFSDEAPYKGINLYRLKMIDTDGNFKYSKVVTLLFSGASSVVVYPNPAKEQIRILSSKKISLIEITDISGKLVKIMTSNSDNRYGIKNLQKGLYIIKVLEEENGSVSKKLVIE
jgi:Secretion system C-terminal sorting domain